MRILILGDDYLFVYDEALAEMGVEPDTVEIIAETHGETIGDNRLYQASLYSLRLARAATPELYDAVLIGNNLGVGVGVAQARALPPDMRERTMIRWNMYLSGDERPYVDLGFTHFGNRMSIRADYPHGIRPLDTTAFIAEINLRMREAGWARHT